MLKAISLHEPYASFVADGLKTVETRDWFTSHRGLIAIHAAKTTAHLLEAPALYERATGKRFIASPYFEVPFPLGKIVAVAEVVDSFKVTGRTKVAIADMEIRVNRKVVRRGTLDVTTIVHEGGSLEIPEKEFVLGDLSPGRAAWILKNVHKLPEPVPVRGLQGLWRLDAETERLVREQLAAAPAEARS